MSAQTKTVQPTVVNGINVDDLLALIEGVRRDPAKGKTNWHVTTTWQGQARSRAEIERYEIGGQKMQRRPPTHLEEPRAVAAPDRFANPHGHLISPLKCNPAGAPAR